MRKLLFVLVVAGSGLAAANCTSYSPDLGGAPYLCANDVCPDGYVCMMTPDMPPRDKVCVSEGGMPPDAGSGGGFQCANDGTLEPNDNPQMNAFQTDVPTAPMMTRSFGPLSICPEGDKDHFAIALPAGMQSIAARVTWDSGMPLSVSILNGGATSIGNGSPNGAREVRACAANLPMGTYYVSVFAGGIKNNYRVKMKLCPSCTFGTGVGECNLDE